MTLKIKFLGAAGTVTGSKYLVSSDSQQILVDSGMFQGSHELTDRNWAQPKFAPDKIAAVLITHAHIDHIGMLPRFYKLGLRCPVYCTAATKELITLLLLDAGRLQEEEAEYRSKKSKASRFSPPLPLFTEDDAKQSLKLLETVKFNKEYEIIKNVFATWAPMGHILGAGSINLRKADKMITFSGDIGRYDSPILVDPAPVKLGNLLLIEATYGDRLHSEDDVKIKLAEIINRVYRRSGVVMIPSFAVGRAQQLLYFIRELKADGLIPDLPVYLDSPMAADATEIYRRHPDCYDKNMHDLLNAGIKPFTCSNLSFTRSREESMSLNRKDTPMIIIAAGGMLTGGRILHHVKERISNPKNCLVFVGFQAPGSKGDLLRKGAKSVILFGEEIPVRAEIDSISGLSAHGDQSELLRWLNSCEGKPEQYAIIHAETKGAEALKTKLDQLGWSGFIAKDSQEVEL